jgi:hypothetical protein
MKDSMAQQCLDILKRDDVKTEFKILFQPLLDFVLNQINPYIYLTITLVFLIFIMILAILVILIFILRNKQIISKFLNNNSN